ncbi:MAG: ArnT family glycosyltransferase [Candidatus Saccharibacteria bacterium]
MKQLLNNTPLRYLLYLLALTPLFLFRDFSLDNELRYLSIADEALHNHSFFTFKNHGILYADKPPLYLWIVMAGKLLLGMHSLLFLGFFSILPALGIIYTMDQWVKDLLSPMQRIAAEMMLLTTAFFMGTAIVLRMDMLMCLFIVLSLYIFFKWHSGQGKPIDRFLFPLCVFMAIFSKGPIGFIVPLVSISVFLWIKKELKTMGRYWGLRSLAIILGLCAIWFTGVYTEGGKQYFNDLLFNQTFNRAVHSFHHSEPFYYYLLAIWYSLLPWSLLIIGVMGYGIRQKLLHNDLELFFLVIAFSTLITLSLFSSKLAVYMLPAFPFMVYLSVIWLTRINASRWVLWTVAIPSLLLCLALPGAFVIQYFNFNTSFLILIAALIISATGVLTLKQLKGYRLNQGIITLCTGLLLAIFTLSFALPPYNEWIGMSRLCEKAKSIAQRQGTQNYYFCNITRADNLDVYLGQAPKMLRIKDLYHTDQSMQKPAVLFVSQKFIDRSDSIRQFVKNRTKYRYGNYYCVEVE